MTDVRALATPRLDLVPATASLLRAEMEDPRLFFHMLEVRPIEDWPPGDLILALALFREQLERHPDLAGWLSWYWVLRCEDAPHPGGADRTPECVPSGVVGPSRGRTARSAGCEDLLSPPVLIGSGGFKGPPNDGSVEIGYHVREAHRRRGYAAEALRALLTWAFAHPEVTNVIAQTTADNAASIGLLEKLGFARVGGGSGPGLIRFAAPQLPP